MALEMLLGLSDGTAKADRARRSVVVRAHLLTMVGAAVAVAALPVVSGPFERRLGIAGLLLLAAGFGWVPLRLGRPRLASLVSLLNFVALIFGVSLFAGGVRAPVFSALLLLSAAAATLLNWRAAVVSSAVGILGGFALLQLELSGRLPASTVVHTPETTFGAYALFLVMITVPLAVAGRSACVLVTRLDVELAERRRIEEQLRESEARLKAIVENTSGFLGLLTTDGRVLVTNSRSLSAAEESRESPAGRFAWEMPWLIDRPELVAWVRSAVARAAAGEDSRETHSGPGPDGTYRHHEVAIRAVRVADDRVGFIVVEIRDVTELQSVDRMKDQFLAIAAHELKTPVTIMKGYAQALLRADEGSDAPRRRLLSAIDRGADRIDRVVRDLLDVSRLQSGQLELEIEPLSVPILVREVADRLALIGPRHRLEVKAPPAVRLVRGDRYRLEQAFAVVIDNAIRYSPDGGDVRIEIVETDREVVVSMSDQGIGIPAGAQSRLFERFFRAHSGTPYDYGGMGVGLYIAREIVGRHGGRIWFESAEGAGSTFHIALPVAE
jgi:signal transduction histidine kinase